MTLNTKTIFQSTKQSQSSHSQHKPGMIKVRSIGHTRSRPVPGGGRGRGKALDVCADWADTGPGCKEADWLAGPSPGQHRGHDKWWWLPFTDLAVKQLSLAREYTGLPGHRHLPPEAPADAATVFCECSFCHRPAAPASLHSTFVFLRSARMHWLRCLMLREGWELHLIWHKLPRAGGSCRLREPQLPQLDSVWQRQLGPASQA